MDEIYKGKFVFPMKVFVSFGTDCQSMYFMSTRFLKGNMNGVRVLQFQIDYICNTTHPSHKIWLSCVVNYIICGGEINKWNFNSGRVE